MPSEATIDPLPFLAGGGEAARMIRARDWTGHALGAPADWEPELKAALSLVLNSPESMILAWGPELIFFFNDTYFPLLGPRLPWAMGARFDEVWADAWGQAKPIIDDAMAGRSRHYDDLPWTLGTDRGARETWWSFSYSRVLDGDGAPAGLFIFTNETTARVLGDKALRESQSNLEAALAEVRDLNVALGRQVDERTRERNRLWETTNDLMATAGLDGFLKTVNPAWTQMLGWSDVELLGRPFFDIIEPADHAETIEVVRRLAAGETVTEFVDHVLGKDGGWRTIMWTAVPEPHSEVFYIIGRDLTAQHRIEEALRQSQKMEAVGQLTGGLAHDFNNLLAGISGSLELAAMRIRQGRVPEVDRYLVAAQGATKRAAALTHRLLAFSRRQTLDPKPTSVNALITGMEDLIRRTVGPSVALESVAAGGIWNVLVDPNQLENALLNLCINARDAMPDGGKLCIETGNRWLDERGARERDLQPGQYVSLCVSDNGTGMTPDIVEKAFEPFFTTKPIGVGTGLGLSMIYGFARQSGGQVRIYSEAGQGTMVCIYLPRHLGDAEEASVLAQAAEIAKAEAGETVLVIDDEPLVRMLVVDVLEELGYQAIEVGDGPSGMVVLQSDARIDLLITDVGLPNGMNGRQVADAARVLRPDLKVLFVTGYAENAVLNHGHLEHGMQVVTKPFNMDDLARRIAAIIAEG